eukprot:9501614-Pyramimonas_sp.AAC.1
METEREIIERDMERKERDWHRPNSAVHDELRLGTAAGRTEHRAKGETNACLLLDIAIGRIWGS